MLWKFLKDQVCTGRKIHRQPAGQSLQAGFRNPAAVDFPTRFWNGACFGSQACLGHRQNFASDICIDQSSPSTAGVTLFFNDSPHSLMLVTFFFPHFSALVTTSEPQVFVSVTHFLPHSFSSGMNSFPHFSAFLIIFFPHFTGSGAKHKQYWHLEPLRPL